MKAISQKTNLYPQFERSPEAFPALTIFPDGWDMSELLSASDVIPAKLFEKSASDGLNPVERHAGM
jgi:hypothetical protein